MVTGELRPLIAEGDGDYISGKFVALLTLLTFVVRQLQVLMERRKSR